MQKRRCKGDEGARRRELDDAPGAVSVRSPVRALAFALFFAALLGCAQLASSKKVLGTKVRSQNKVFKVDASTDLDMCKAIIREMHTELLKHNLKEDGEDNIFDTAGMAICLGVVQNYTFEEGPKSKWKLVRKENSDEDSLYDSFSGANEAEGAKMVEGLMLTKKACMDFAEELQLEISEVMYARVHEATGDEIADAFCPNAVKPQKKEKTTYVPAATAQERSKSDPTALMTDMLRTRDTSGAISELLEMEAAFPERMLEPPLQAELNKAVEQMTCQVCKVAVKQAHAKVKVVEKVPDFKDKWQRQSLVAEAVNIICHGPDYEKLNNGFYPSVPGNPPTWANDYYIFQQDGQYKLKKGKPSVDAMRAIVTPRLPPATGQDKEEVEQEEWDGTKHEYDVMRLAVIRTACKHAIDQRLDTEDGDLAELLLEKRGDEAKSVAQLYCKPLCSKKLGQQEL